MHSSVETRYPFRRGRRLLAKLHPAGKCAVFDKYVLRPWPSVGAARVLGGKAMFHAPFGSFHGRLARFMISC